MKKIGTLLAATLLVGTILSSCKSSGPHCAAYSKADAPKIKNIKSI